MEPKIVITPLPPMIKAVGFNTPEEAIRAGTATNDAKAAAAISQVVSGSIIQTFLESDGSVLFWLEGLMGIEVDALVQTPRCGISVKTNNDATMPKATRTLGESAQIDWAGDIGCEEWPRISILNGMIGQKIDRIAFHTFGTSFYLSGSRAIMFSSLMIAGNPEPLLYWSLMKL